MSEAGIKRMGSPGAIDAIINYAALNNGWDARDRLYEKLKQSFEDVYFLHTAANMDIVNDLIIKTHPQHFVLERIDRNYFSFDSFKALKKFYGNDSTELKTN